MTLVATSCHRRLVKGVLVLSSRLLQRLHPLVVFCYFAVVLVATMFQLHPYVATLSLVCAVVTNVLLQGTKKGLQSFVNCLPFVLLIALFNPLFVHKGDTVLLFVNDNPLTLEAIVYGVVMAVTIGAVVTWCSCFSAVFTSDKTVYLFGKVAPKFSAVLTLTLGFVPRLVRRYRQIDDAQRALGLYANGSVWNNLLGKARVFSMLLTDSLEGGVTTADSMRARGFGLYGRSCYSPYFWTFADTVTMSLTVLFGSATVVFFALRMCFFQYYPVLKGLELSLGNFVSLLCCALLFSLGALLEIKDNLQWRLLKQTI